MLLEDDHVCLIRRDVNDATYYLFPGGGVEAGEGPEEAARREAFEELGLHVEVQHLVARVDYERGTQLFYLARRTGGVFGTGPEQDWSPDPARGTWTAVWLPLMEALECDTRPSGLCEILRAGKHVDPPGVFEIPY